MVRKDPATLDYFVAVTDNDWYSFLADRKPDEVNYWRPKGKGFRAIPIGAPFLFKLHSPEDYIAGGGFFVRYERLPMSLAWDAFEEKNGADSLRELRRLILSHRGGSEIDPEIGCVILNDPFFFPRDKCVPIPKDWSKNIVFGKGYSTETTIGRELWEQVTERILMLRASQSRPDSWHDQPAFGAQYLARARLGQGAFRILVTDAYGRRCAMSGEKTLPVLEAAHIKPFSETGPTRVENGILIRSDLHKLFDRGYITVTPEHRIEVSRRLKDDYDNGRDYYPLHGRVLARLPRDLADHPRREFLAWHNENVYLG